MSLIVVNDVACPYCGARAGKDCRVARDGGRRLPYPHVARRLAFRVAKAGEPRAATGELDAGRAGSGTPGPAPQ